MTAIAADRIFVRRLSIVGSIGVLFKTENAQKLMQTIGVDIDKVQSGPLKAEPDIDEPMSDEVRASLQSLVDDSFSWFVDIVAERRGLTRAEVLPLADGRIMTGNQGIANKLVDEVGGEAEAIAWLEANKSIAADLPVATWYPRAEPSWMAWENWLGQARTALGLPSRGPVVLDGLVLQWLSGKRGGRDGNGATQRQYDRERADTHTGGEAARTMQPPPWAPASRHGDNGHRPDAHGLLDPGRRAGASYRKPGGAARGSKGPPRPLFAQTSSLC